MTPKHIRIFGAVAVLAGLIAAGIIFGTTQPEEPMGILGLDIRTKRDRLQLERMGGPGYVLMRDFDDWFGSLWHGRKLSYTIAVLSVVTFFLCRGVAYVHEHNPPVDYPDPDTWAKKPDKAP